MYCHTRKRQGKVHTNITGICSKSQSDQAPNIAITLAGRLIAQQLSWNIQPTNLWQILTANNDSMSILGVCNVKLGVGSRHINTHIYITSQIHQMILGSDWLAERRCITWDLVNAKIRLGTRSKWVPWPITPTAKSTSMCCYVQK